jgi:hypothetical protein
MKIKKDNLASSRIPVVANIWYYLRDQIKIEADVEVDNLVRSRIHDQIKTQMNNPIWLQTMMRINENSKN